MAVWMIRRPGCCCSGSVWSHVPASTLVWCHRRPHGTLHCWPSTTLSGKPFAGYWVSPPWSPGHCRETSTPSAAARRGCGFGTGVWASSPLVTCAIWLTSAPLGVVSVSCWLFLATPFHLLQRWTFWPRGGGRPVGACLPRSGSTCLLCPSFAWELPRDSTRTSGAASCSLAVPPGRQIFDSWPPLSAAAAIGTARGLPPVVFVDVNRNSGLGG